MKPSLLLALLMSSDAFACSVCGVTTTPEQQEAILSGTIGLTVLPLTMLAAVAYVVYRQYRGGQEQNRTPKKVPRL